MMLSATTATDVTFTYEPEKDKAQSTRIYAHRGEQAVGVLKASLFSKSLPHAAYIQSFYVPREHRGTGVAMALLKEALRWLKEHRPELRWVLADVRWTGSLKVMEAALGPSFMQEQGDLLPVEPMADWTGVRDGHSLQTVWFVGDKKGWLKPLYMQGMNVVMQAFYRDTEFFDGKKLRTVRKQ